MQKFNKGDLVKVAKDLGQCMSHFTNDCEAIVMYSYNDKYGGGNTKSYGIYIKGEGQTAWYEEPQLELIEAGRIDLLDKWEAEAKKEAEEKSDIDWIFENGEEVLTGAHGATVSALAKCLGCDNLWGSNGEGFVYYQNAMAVMAHAEPFLKTGDKQGYLNHCKSLGL